MGKVPFQEDDSVIICEKSKAAQKKRKENRGERLRRAGFNPDLLSKQHTLQMNKENFKKIAEEQLRLTDVKSQDPNFVKLPYMNSFKDEMDLHKQVWDVLEHFEIDAPTPVQMVAIPYMMNTKSDLIIHAQTGSGKTFAMLLPIIDYTVKVKSKLSDKTNSTSPYAVIVAPTCELVQQLYRDAIRLTDKVNCVRVAFGHGGLDMRDSTSMLKDGCDILVVTPGRLYDYFNSRDDHRGPRLNTKNIKFVVLDEADKLVEIEHSRKNESELAPMQQLIMDFVVKKLTNEDKVDFRCILLSATMNNPFLYDLVVPTYIKIDVGSQYPVSTVMQDFVEIKHEHEKLETLFDIIDTIAESYNPSGEMVLNMFDEPYQKIGKTIIFCNNKRVCDRLFCAFRTLGFQSASISSERTARQRHEIMRDMTMGLIDILVTTDVLSRGVNIPRVEYVINFDHPQNFSHQEYIHRVGRCGRVGNYGKATTLFDPTKDYAAAHSLIIGCEKSGQPVPKVLLKCMNYDNYNDYLNDIRSNRRNHSPPNFFNNQHIPRNPIRNNYYAESSDSGHSSPGSSALTMKTIINLAPLEWLLATKSNQLSGACFSK